MEVVRYEFGITPDGMRMFGFLEVNIEVEGLRLGVACRNSHDKAFALGIVAGYRTFCCDNLSFRGDFMAVSRKHSKSLQDVIAVGIDRVQRQYEPMLAQIDAWKHHSLSDTLAREIIYKAFIEEQIDAPKHLAKDVHRLY